MDEWKSEQGAAGSNRMYLYLIITHSQFLACDGGEKTPPCVNRHV